MRITISQSDGSGGGTLYACPEESEVDCLVDLANQDELDDLAEAASMAEIPVGSYSRIAISTCTPEKSGADTAPAYVRGSFEVFSEGKTYSTAAAASNGLKEGGDAEFTAVEGWSCADRAVVLPVPLQIEPDSETDLTIVVDNVLLAGSHVETVGPAGFCKGDEEGNRNLCVNYPSFVPYVGDGEPSVSRMLLTHHLDDPKALEDSKANGYIGVVRDPSGVPLMAFVRSRFSEDSAMPTSGGMSGDPLFGGPAYGAETGMFRVEEDGSISFDVGGSSDLTSAIFTGFRVEEHEGTVRTREGTPWHYRALWLDP